MAKYYGTIGYANRIETEPGIWEEQIIEKNYYGDIIKNYSRWNASDKVNDDISLGNQISILADAYAIDNCQYIRYITWMKSKWKVSSIEVQPPRLILSLGEPYLTED